MNANQILERGGGIAWSALRVPGRLLGGSFGFILRVTHLRQAPKPGMDDETIAAKVESVIFRSSSAPKATVSINVVDGIVWLRGEVKTANQVRSLETKTRSIPEVRGVENLLHLSKTPSPTRADSPRRQQRTRSSTKRATPRRTRGRVTDDRSDAIVADAEPSPQEHAREGTGRTPAPFGAQDPEPSAPETSAADTSPATEAPATAGTEATQSPAIATPATPSEQPATEQAPTAASTETTEPPASDEAPSPVSAEDTGEHETGPAGTSDPSPGIATPETERVP